MSLAQTISKRVQGACPGEEQLVHTTAELGMEFMSVGDWSPGPTRSKVLVPTCPTQYSIFPHFLNWKSHLILLQLPKIHSEERPDSKNLLVLAHGSGKDAALWVQSKPSPGHIELVSRKLVI